MSRALSTAWDTVLVVLRLFASGVVPTVRGNIVSVYVAPVFVAAFQLFTSRGGTRQVVQLHFSARLKNYHLVLGWESRARTVRSAVGMVFCVLTLGSSANTDIDDDDGDGGDDGVLALAHLPENLNLHKTGSTTKQNKNARYGSKRYVPPNTGAVVALHSRSEPRTEAIAPPGRRC